MLRVRPGVLLVRASFAPTSVLITLDFPTFDRPRKAISGTPGAGKCVKSLADSMNRARIRIQTVSSVWVAHGKRVLHDFILARLCLVAELCPAKLRALPTRGYSLSPKS